MSKLRPDEGHVFLELQAVGPRHNAGLGLFLKKIIVDGYRLIIASEAPAGVLIVVDLFVQSI